jgi:hypothetical protein
MKRREYYRKIVLIMGREKNVIVAVSRIYPSSFRFDPTTLRQILHIHYEKTERRRVSWKTPSVFRRALNV